MEKKTKMKIVDIFKEICKLLELSDAVFENQVADFFQLISTDKNFIVLDKGYCDLRKKHAPKVVIEETEEDPLEAEEIEEIPELVIPAEEGVGVEDCQGDTQHRADDGDQEGIEVAPPQGAAQFESVGEGLGAPGDRCKGVANLADAFLRGEGNDDNKDEGDNAHEGEHAQHGMECCLGPFAEAVQGEGARLDLFMSNSGQKVYTSCDRR